MQIFFMGRPGSGKSSVAEAAAVALSVPLISTGDLMRLRAEVDLSWYDAMMAGEVGDPHVMDVLVRRLLRHAVDGGHMVIYDGYPRYFEQLADILITVPSQDICFVSVEAGPAVCAERAVARGRVDMMNWHARERLFEERAAPMLDWIEGRLDRGWIFSVDNDGNRPLAQAMDEAIGFISEFISGERLS